MRKRMMGKLRKISTMYYLRQIVACLLVYCILLAVPMQVALATVSNADVVAGSAGVSQSGNTTTVNMGSARAVINWDSLNTNSNEILQFLKASGNFAVLNRVIQGGATQFDGSLFGNQGHIIIVNPNGIVFGPTALVQAHKFTASALDIANTDFMNSIYNFTGGGVGEVANYGDISAEQVALIGRNVLNAGVIRSPGGYVLLAAGDKVLLGQDGSNVVVEVEGVTVPDTMDAAAAGIGDVINEGTVEAAGGKIVLAAGDTFSRAINGLDSLTAAVNGGTGRVGQFGTLNADGVEGDGGNITLTAGDVVALSSDSVTTANAGANGDGGQVIAYSPDTALFREGAQIEAKGGSESGDGGFIEVSGKNHVEIRGFVNASAPHGSAGTFLIDPTDITVQAADPGNIIDDGGGTFTTTASANTISDDTIEGYLEEGTNVTLDTSNYRTDGYSQGPYDGSGDITVSAAIDPTGEEDNGDVTLTLYAADDIIVNAAIDGSGLFGGSKLDVALHANKVIANPIDDLDTGAGNVDINADITTAGGFFTSSGIDFDNTGGVITTNDGKVDIQNTGAVTIGAAINAGAGDVDIDGGDLGVATSIAGGGTITSSSTITLEASGSIGWVGAAINTASTGTINASSTSSGNIYIDNTGAVALGTVSTAGSDIVINNAGTITVAAAGGGITAAGTGIITLNADGNTSDVVVNDGITSASGNITLAADDDVTFGADGDVTSTSGDVTVTADADGDASGTGGALTMVDRTVINAGSGKIDLDADENIALGRLVTTNNTATAVAIDTTNGAVTDAGDTGGEDIEATGASAVVTINAVTGVGSGNAIETKVTTIDIDNATSGNIEIDETDALNINKIAQATAGNIDVVADGLITVVAGQSGVTAVGTGTISLDADNDSSMVINAGITSASGNITLAADDDVTFGADGDVTSTSGDVTVTADADGDASGTGGALTMVDGTVINAGSGKIDLDADEDITIGSVQTTSTAADAVTVTTTSGAVVDGGDTDVDVVATSGELDITASTGVGSAGGGGANAAIETTVATLEATSTTGNIAIIETDDLILRTIDAVAGSIYLEATGGGMTYGAGTITAGASTLTMVQQDSLDLKDFSFGNQDGTDFMAEITGSGSSFTADDTVAANAADQWQSIQAKTTAADSGNITLHGLDQARDIVIGTGTGINPGGGHTFDGVVTSTGGGVSIISENKTVRTADDTILDNVAISGSSNDELGTGVDLPYDPTKKAAIVIMGAEDLMLGPGTILTASGTYDTTGAVDDREGVDFLDVPASIPSGFPRYEGDPFDVAIYLQSKDGDVDVSSTVSIMPYNLDGLRNGINGSEEPYEPEIVPQGAMVIDAWDTVTFDGGVPGGLFETSLAGNGVFSDVGDRLEVVSRITEWLFQAAGRLPYPSYPYYGGGPFPSDYTYTYVLRGAGLDNPAIAAITDDRSRAWVLVDPKNAPLDREAGENAEKQALGLDGCPVLLAAASAELGIPGETIEVSLANAYALNTDIQPCESCARLVNAAAILRDEDGSRMAAANQVFNALAPADAPFTPEVAASIVTAFAGRINDGTQYATAIEYIDAFVRYIAVLSTEMGSPVGDSLAFVMDKYGAGVLGSDNSNIAAFVATRLESGETFGD